VKTEQQRFLIDVGMSNLHFPIRARSRVDEKGQPTVAEIGIIARIWKKFEASWIDKFIQIVHRHRDTIGPETLRANIMDYYEEFRAASVRVDFRYPFFYEKTTPVSKEKCLVRYRCRYSAKIDSIDTGPRVIQQIKIPVITTYPGSVPGVDGGLFAQHSVVECEIETNEFDLFPEDVIDIVDKQALMPVYSFLTPDDQAAIIKKVHTEERSSVVLTDEVKKELGRHPAVHWYAVRISNFGILHSYSTFVGTEKSTWAPLAPFEDPPA